MDALQLQHLKSGMQNSTVLNSHYCFSIDSTIKAIYYIQFNLLLVVYANNAIQRDQDTVSLVDNFDQFAIEIYSNLWYTNMVDIRENKVNLSFFPPAPSLVLSSSLVVGKNKTCIFNWKFLQFNPLQK